MISESGQWVYYSDARTEIERLKAEVDRLKALVGYEVSEEIKDLREQVNHWKTKAEYYGNMVHGCGPALEAAGFPVDSYQSGGWRRGVKRAVEALAADRDRWKTDHDAACRVVAQMHAAAVGEVRGPSISPVDDIAKLKTERDKQRDKARDELAYLSGQLKKLVPLARDILKENP